MKRTTSAGGVVLNQKGEVLVVSQQGTSWSLPKGHIDAKEDAVSAARREIEEEAGITDLKLIRELGSYERPRIDDPTEIKTIHMFLFTTNQSDTKPIDPNNPEAIWVNKQEVEKLLTAEKDKDFFRSIRKEIRL